MTKKQTLSDEIYRQATKFLNDYNIPGFGIQAACDNHSIWLYICLKTPDGSNTIRISKYGYNTKLTHNFYDDIKGAVISAGGGFLNEA